MQKEYPRIGNLEEETLRGKRVGRSFVAIVSGGGVVLLEYARRDATAQSAQSADAAANTPVDTIAHSVESQYRHAVNGLAYVGDGILGGLALWGLIGAVSAHRKLRRSARRR